MSSQVVMITGGAKGIGRACAEEFLKNGACVSILSRTLSELKTTTEELNKTFPGRINFFCGDIGKEETVKKWFQEVFAKWGTSTTLINNAAIFTNQLVRDQSLEDWEKVIKVNITGSFLCAREFFNQPNPQKFPRAILNISSLAGIRGTEKFPGLSSYTTSKFGAIGLTEALAVEGRALGVRVNCIAPGAVDTEMLRQALPQLRAKATPADIARIAFFLCEHSQSGVVTGSTIEVFSNV